MTVQVTYSHAAPWIRRQIIYEIGMSTAARTQRDRLRNLNRAEGLAQSLQFILTADSTKDEPAGIAELDTILLRYYAEAKKYLRERWVALGFDEPESLSGDVQAKQAVVDRCGVCGGTIRLQCEQCGWGGTWLDPVGDGQLACRHCGHTQPALCADPEHRSIES